MCEWTVAGSPSGETRHRRGGETPCEECRNARNAYNRSRRDPVRSMETKINGLWALYRLRRHEYEAILAQQQHCCAICRSSLDGPRKACTDHDHACDHPGKGAKSCAGCVRGILCNRCNTALMILDDVEWLKKALDYLDREDVAEIIRQSRLWS